MPLSPAQLNQIKRQLKDKGFSDDKIDITVRKVQEQYEQRIGSSPLPETNYTPAPRPTNQTVNSSTAPRSNPSTPPMQSTASVQPQTEQEENSVSKFFSSLFSIAPDVGQTIAGLASLPVTAPLSAVNPTAGKAVRTAIGAVGRTGGEVVNQAGTNLVNDLENWNNPDYVPSLFDKNVANQNLKDLGTESAIGVASEAVGEFVIGPAFERYVSPVIGKLFKGGAKIANKALSPFKGSVNKEVVELATEKGIDLPVSAKTSSNFVKQTEALVQKSFFGESVTKKVIAAKDSVDALSRTITDDLAKPIDKKSVGQVVKEGFEKFEESFLKTKSELYNQVPKQVYKAEGVMDSTLKLLDDIDIRRGQSNVKNKAPFFSELAENLKSKPQTFQTLKQTRTDIIEMSKNFNDPIATGNKADLKALIATLSDDIEDTVRRLDPDAYELLDQANTFYREGLDKVNSKIGQQIKNATPEKLLDTLLKPNSETDIALVKDILGTKGVKELQDGFTSKLYNDSVNTKTQLLDVSKLRTQIKKYGEASIKELLGEGGYTRLNQTIADLTDIETLNQAINRGVKPAEGSQTAFLLNMIGTIQGTAAAMFFNPVAAIGGATIWTGGQYGLYKMVTTEAGQKWLTEGIETFAKENGVNLSKPASELVKRLSVLLSTQLTDQTVSNQASGEGANSNTQNDGSGNNITVDNESQGMFDVPNSDQITDQKNEFQNAPLSDDIIPQTTSNDVKIDLPFNGMSKYEVVQLAVARGFSGSQLDEVRNTYDSVMADYKEALGETGDVDALIKRRSDLKAAGYSTKPVDEQLSAMGYTLSDQTETGDLISQINNLETVGERGGARSAKELLDLVTNAMTSAKDTPTGPVSALGAKASKLTSPNRTAQLEKDLTELLRTIRKESTGVHFSPQEIADLEKEIPTIMQQEGNVEDSLKRLKIRMLQKLQNYGIDVTNELDNDETDPTQDQKKKIETPIEQASDQTDKLQVMAEEPNWKSKVGKQVKEYLSWSSDQFQASLNADPSTLSDSELLLRDPGSLSKEDRLRQTDAALQFVGSVSPLTKIKVAKGNTLKNVIKEARNIQYDDIPQFEQIIDLLRKKSRGNLGEVGKEAQAIAKQLGLDITQGNKELARSLEGIVEVLEKIEPKKMFNIPNLLKKK